MNNEFETLGIDNNPGQNTNPVNTNPNEALEQTAENIIEQVNQEINNTPAPAPTVAPEVTPVVEPVVAPEAPVSAPVEAAPQEAAPQIAPAEQQVAPQDANVPQGDMSNISYDNKENYNEFAEEKPKKKVSASSIIILIVLLIGLAGAVYYSVFYKDMFNLGLGNGGGSQTPLAAKEVTIELGSEIPTDITVYMNRALNATEYKLITSKINNNEVGEYSFEVTYNGNTYKGTAKVVDSAGPTVTTKDVTVASAGMVAATDFVDDCTDLSGCTVEFSSDYDASQYTENGTYTVTLVATDQYNNTTTVSANLIIDDTAGNTATTSKYTCTKSSPSSDYAATIAYALEFTIDDSNNVIGVTDKRTYTFDTADELTKHKDAGDSNFTYDETNLTAKSSKSLTSSEMSNDSTYKSFLKTKAELTTFMAKYGYTCN